MKKQLLFFATLLNTASILIIASEKTTTEKSMWAKLKEKAANAVDTTKAKLKSATTTTKKKTESTASATKNPTKAESKTSTRETRTIYWENAPGQILSIKPSDIRYDSLLKNINAGTAKKASFDMRKLAGYKEPIIYYKNSTTNELEAHTPDSQMYDGYKMLLDMKSDAVSTDRSKIK